MKEGCSVTISSPVLANLPVTNFRTKLNPTFFLLGVVFLCDGQRCFSPGIKGRAILSHDPLHFSDPSFVFPFDASAVGSGGMKWRSFPLFAVPYYLELNPPDPPLFPTITASPLFTRLVPVNPFPQWRRLLFCRALRVLEGLTKEPHSLRGFYYCPLAVLCPCHMSFAQNLILLIRSTLKSLLVVSCLYLSSSLSALALCDG